jgi:hypothetical protein
METMTERYDIKVEAVETPPTKIIYQEGTTVWLIPYLDQPGQWAEVLEYEADIETYTVEVLGTLPEGDDGIREITPDQIDPELTKEFSTRVTFE